MILTNNKTLPPSVEWYTPDDIITAVQGVLGTIDLDPCSNSHDTPNIPAVRHFTVDDNGLAQPWFGNVYMNPPYDKPLSAWCSTLLKEFDLGRVTVGLALVPASTETRWFSVFDDHAVCFIRRRLKFKTSPSASGVRPANFPSAIVYRGSELDRFIRYFRPMGNIRLPAPALDRDELCLAADRTH